MWDLIVSVPDHCLSFYFIKLEDNLSRHKISQVFKIWTEWTIYIGVTCLDC